MKTRILLISIVMLLCSSCTIEQKAKLIIKNESDYSVKDLNITYSTSDGDNSKALDLLEVNSEKKFIVTIAETEWAFGGGSYASGFRIEYTLNDTVFNRENNFDSVPEMGYGNSDGGLYENSETVITIKNDGYRIQE